MIAEQVCNIHNQILRLPNFAVEAFVVAAFEFTEAPMIPELTVRFIEHTYNDDIKGEFNFTDPSHPRIDIIFRSPLEMMKTLFHEIKHYQDWLTRQHYFSAYDAEEAAEDYADECMEIMFSNTEVFYEDFEVVSDSLRDQMHEAYHLMCHMMRAA